MPQIGTGSYAVTVTRPNGQKNTVVSGTLTVSDTQSTYSFNGHANPVNVTVNRDSSNVSWTASKSNVGNGHIFNFTGGVQSGATISGGQVGVPPPGGPGDEDDTWSMSGPNEEVAPLAADPKKAAATAKY